MFICLTRDHENCVASGFYKEFDKSDVLRALKKADQDFEVLASRKPSSMFRIDYRDVVPDSPVLERLFERIGRRPSPAALEERLAQPTSYDRRSWQTIAFGHSVSLDRALIERLGIVLKLDRQNHPSHSFRRVVLKGIAAHESGDTVSATLTRRGLISLGRGRV